MNKNMEEILKNFSLKTSELIKTLDQLKDIDINSLNKKELDKFLEQLENIEILTGKAESLALKTKRDGVPEIINNRPEEKLENKKENKQKSRSLMKPTLNQSPLNPYQEKDRERK